MAHGDYYNPTNKSVVDGAIVYAEDVNKINTAVDSALDQVAADLDDLEASIGDGGVASKDWATEDAGTRPDPILDLYSSRAYAAEAKGWASAAGTIIEASTGVPLVGSSSAKTQATAAAASAVTASGHATTASNAAIAAAASAVTASGFANTASGHATSASGFATAASDYADDASGFADDASGFADAASDSADAITAIYSTFTAAGIALLDDATAADQRATLSLNNVNNTSDANKPVSTAQQSALDLKFDANKVTKGANATSMYLAVDGRVIQAGSISFSGGSSTVLFPLAFPTNLVAVTATTNEGALETSRVWTTGGDRFGMAVFCESSASVEIHWIAFGY